MSHPHQNAILLVMNNSIKYHPYYALAFLLTAFVLSVVPFIPIFFNSLSSIYMEFPPRELYTEKKPFSYFAFFFVIALSSPFIFILIKNLKELKKRKVKSRFPIWGYLAVLCLAASWVLAWKPLEGLSEQFKYYSFSMLWLSYIFVANALLKARTGQTLFYSGFYMSFLLSVSYWWLFEYLNRFVQNWYYQGTTMLDADGYFKFASYSFATLLPSVWVTKELIESFFVMPVKNEAQYFFNDKKCFYSALISVFSCIYILSVLRVYPSVLFPLVWVMPVVLYCAFSVLLVHSSSGVVIDKHFFYRTCFWALACLLCGFLWEMWNYKSLVKWIYHISYVDTLRVFEMPLLGYLGYLPFGLCCWIPVAFIEFSFERTSQP